MPTMLSHPLLKAHIDKLQCADFSFLHVDHHNVDVLVEFLQNHPLRSLDLFGNYLTPKSIQRLGEAFAFQPTLFRLDLSFNTIEDEGICMVVDSLRYHPAIRILELCACGMSQIGLEAITNLLRTNPRIEQLDISMNPIGVFKSSDSTRVQALQPFDKFVESVRAHPSLTHLYLRENRLWDECLQLLCQALRDNSTLEHLDLKRNFIRLECLQTICNTLDVNTTLRHIDLGYGHSSGEMETISHRLERNNRLRYERCRMFVLELFEAIALRKGCDVEYFLVPTFVYPMAFHPYNPYNPCTFFE